MNTHAHTHAYNIISVFLILYYIRYFSHACLLRFLVTDSCFLYSNRLVLIIWPWCLALIKIYCLVTVFPSDIENTVCPLWKIMHYEVNNSYALP